MGIAKRSSRFIGSLTLILLSTVVCLGLLEIGIRIVYPHDLRALEITSDGRPILTYDPKVVRRRPANAQWIYGSVPFHANSHGWRGPEFDIEKQEGQFRIVLVGDSFVEGYGEQWEDSFVSVVGQELAARWPDEDAAPEVLALGLGGNDILDYAIVLREEALQLDPDLILVNVFTFNDLRPDRLSKTDFTGGAAFYTDEEMTSRRQAFEARLDEVQADLRAADLETRVVQGIKTYYRPILDAAAPKKGLREYSRLAEVAISRLKVLNGRLMRKWPQTYGAIYRRLRGRESEKYGESGDTASAGQQRILARGLSTYRAPMSEAQKNAYDVAITLIMEMKSHSERRGVDFGVYVHANGDQVYPHLIAPEAAAIGESDPEMFDPLQPNRILAEAASAHGVSLATALPVMQQFVEENPTQSPYQGYDPNRAWYSGWWGHYNRAGNQIVGEDLAAFILREFISSEQPLKVTESANGDSKN